MTRDELVETMEAGIAEAARRIYGLDEPAARQLAEGALSAAEEHGYGLDLVEAGRRAVAETRAEDEVQRLDDAEAPIPEIDEAHRVMQEKTNARRKACAAIIEAQTATPPQEDTDGR